MEPVKWKKIGGGSFLMEDGRRIKPNQVFMATEDQIPQGFRKMVIRFEGAIPSTVRRIQTQLKLEAIPVISVPSEPDASPAVEEALEDAKDSVFKMAPRGIGWWNVVNTSTGKVLNEKALRHTDALKMIESLLA